MAAAHLMGEGLAEKTGVDPKTVQRWLAGRVPHQRYRWAVARVLGRDETYLWPEGAREAGRSAAVELVAFYAHRSDVPPDFWWARLQAAQHQMDLLAYAALFLPEQHIRLINLLSRKASAGCRVRILLGDPEGRNVRQRGVEERFGEGIASRVRVALRHYEPLHGSDGIQIRLHDTTLYNSIYRFDDTMLVNSHVYGTNAYSAPVLHLQRSEPGGLFDTFADSFEAVWELARPFVQLKEQPGG
jgi:transcriptional regulator with XRE-family HTH domain